MRALLATTVSRERIVNCYETSWKVDPDNLVTWAVRGADQVPIAINSNIKAEFTAFCSMTAARTKLPLVLIPSGKTQRVERNQFGDIEPHVRMRTMSEWTTVYSLQDSLVFLRSQLPGPEPLDLILDCYSARRGPQIRESAQQLGIISGFIPARMTDSLQPLGQ
jgi:hypothetical protein